MKRNDKYKIGSISKILGIPVQTLHYYESCGFISPEKAENSGYRYYDAWDINFLLDSKYWQSYGYSTADVEKMINTDSIDDIQTKLENQEQFLMDKLCFYQNLLEQVTKEKNRLSKIPMSLGAYEIKKSPLLLFDSYRIRDYYESSKNNEELPKIHDWIQNFPFVQPTFTINQNTINPRNSDSLEYKWGFSISPSKCKELNISFSSKPDILPAQTCIYTVFQANGRNTFVSSLFEQVFNPIWKKGYDITAMPIGRLIIRAHSTDSYKRFFEIWVPIDS